MITPGHTYTIRTGAYVRDTVEIVSADERWIVALRNGHTVERWATHLAPELEPIADVG